MTDQLVERRRPLDLSPLVDRWSSPTCLRALHEGCMHDGATCDCPCHRATAV